MKTLLMIGALSLVAALAGCSHKTAAQTCVAGPDEQCPSDLQLKQDDEMQGISSKFDKKLKSFQDSLAEDRIRYNGLKDELGNSGPKGYHWDEKKRRWVKDPPPVASSTPTPLPVSPQGAHPAQ